MSYIEGFVIPVAQDQRERFAAFAKHTDAMFLEYGATRVVECWGDDIPRGKKTDFFMSVQAKEDENVAFAWIEWPDKATRDAAYEKMLSPDNDDERWDPEKNPPPFDGKRMIFGCFAPVVDLKA